jgi:DNA-directed RNA polymerase
MSNEYGMKVRGENRVWKSIKSQDNQFKKIASTQVGQQLIFEDALNILDDVRRWIDVDSASVYRKDLQNYFENDDILLEKITTSFLLLAGSSYIVEKTSDTKILTRHKRISVIREKIMEDLSFDLVWRFVEVIIEASSYFYVERDRVFKNNKTLLSMKYSCTLSETILNKLAIEAYRAFFPEPMIVPPKEWKFENEELSGGYETYQYELIRARNHQVDYSRYSDKIFEAVNYIQSIPWKVNREVVEQIRRDLVLPKKEDFVKTPYPESVGTEWEIDIKDPSLSKEEVERIQEARKVFSSVAEIYKAEAGDFESALGKYRAVKLALGIAESYIDKVIYFPHSFDFRGRVYPIPVGLSPQGSDAVKSMLLYAEGEKLTEQGEDWCWAYLASLYGDDKIAFDLRVKRGRELINADYKEADEPYQFLAHQLEMKKYLADSNYEVKARIHLDACNSGSQFTSAMTGDRAGCIATNVIPTINEDGTQTRQDAYLLVAEKALQLTKRMILIEQDQEVKEALIFFKELLTEKGRKVCKTPVMVSNYGGTQGGRSEIIWDLLREFQVDRKWITKKNAALFSKVVGDSIEGVLNGGKAFEMYIHKMNDLIAKKNKAITWETSDGFLVIHTKYKELKGKQVSCILPGSRKPTTILKKNFSDKLSAVKMKSAISPNFVHSLDAELLRRVALKCKAAGIDYTDWIHDSFGAHPNHIEQVLYITKKEFKKLARRQPLRLLDTQLREQIDTSKPTQKALAEVGFPQLKGFDSRGGLDIVMESDWFFS